MPFGKSEPVPMDTLLQRDHELLVEATAEALGEGGTAFTLFGEICLPGGTDFTTTAFAAVSDFNPEQSGGRRRSFSMPVPAEVPFRLRVQPIAMADPAIDAWALQVGWLFHAVANENIM